MIDAIEQYEMHKARIKELIIDLRLKLYIVDQMTEYKKDAGSQQYTAAVAAMLTRASKAQSILEMIREHEDVLITLKAGK